MLKEEVGQEAAAEAVVEAVAVLDAAAIEEGHIVVAVGGLGVPKPTLLIQLLMANKGKRFHQELVTVSLLPFWELSVDWDIWDTKQKKRKK